MNLNNKNIIVTGSNRGIGAEIVRDLHKNGANVICCSRKYDIKLIEETKKINKSHDNKIFNYFFDLNNEKEIENSAIKICTEFESIDGLINNAGINHVSLFLMDKISNIKNVFQVNFFLN